MLSAIAILSNTSSAQYKKWDEKYGFKDLVFESSIADFKSKVEWKDHKEDMGRDRVAFEIADDKFLTVGDCHLDHGYAIFYQGHLETIMLFTKGYKNSRCFLETFEAAYGKGFQSNQYIERFLWDGKRAQAYYDESSLDNNATIILESKIVKDKQDAADKAAKEKGAKDL